MRYGHWLLVGVAVAVLCVGSGAGWAQQGAPYRATDRGPVDRTWDTGERTPASDIPSRYPYPTTSTPESRPLDAYARQPATVPAWNQPPQGYPYPTPGTNEADAGFAEATDRFGPPYNPAPVYSGPPADPRPWTRQPPLPDDTRQPYRPVPGADRPMVPYSEPGYVRQPPPPDYAVRHHQPAPGASFSGGAYSQPSPVVSTGPDRDSGPPPPYVRQEPTPQYGRQQRGPEYPPQQPSPADTRQGSRPTGTAYRGPGRGKDFPRVAERPASSRRPEATRPGQAPERPAPECTPCLWAQPLAQVGHDVVLASEVMPEVIEVLEQNADKIPEWEVPGQRLALIKQLVSHRIETKLLCQDAIRNLPKEAIPKIEDRLAEHFDKVKIEELMKEYHADSRRDLEDKLQAVGSSLSRKRREFSEREMAALWLREKLGAGSPVDREELEAYYHEHIDDYRIFAKSRWQQLTARFAKHGGDKQAAWEAICRMGNLVARQGVPFEEVARRYSDGTRARSGGEHDWTRKDSLKSKVLDRAIFTQPIGEMGPILEDEQGFHIVRVTERQEDGLKPFEELQEDIRDKLTQERRRKTFNEHMKKLRKSIPVSTIFDDKVALRRFSEQLERMERVARRDTPDRGPIPKAGW